jgi:hypothetical protein
MTTEQQAIQQYADRLMTQNAVVRDEQIRQFDGLVLSRIAPQRLDNYAQAQNRATRVLDIHEAPQRSSTTQLLQRAKRETFTPESAQQIVNDYRHQVEIGERDVAVEKVRALAAATLEIHGPLQYWRDMAAWRPAMDALDYVRDHMQLSYAFPNCPQTEGVKSGWPTAVIHLLKAVQRDRGSFVGADGLKMMREVSQAFQHIDLNFSWDIWPSSKSVPMAAQLPPLILSGIDPEKIDLRALKMVIAYRDELDRGIVPGELGSLFQLPLHALTLNADGKWDAFMDTIRATDREMEAQGVLPKAEYRIYPMVNELAPVYSHIGNPPEPDTETRPAQPGEEATFYCIKRALVGAPGNNEHVVMNVNTEQAARDFIAQVQPWVAGPENSGDGQALARLQDAMNNRQDAKPDVAHPQGGFSRS